MSECVVLFQIAFTSTNRGKGEIHGFLVPNCPNCLLNVRVSKFHNSIFWQWHLLINKSNQLLVIVFHQSATGESRENLDFAVERQNHA